MILCHITYCHFEIQDGQVVARSETQNLAAQAIGDMYCERMVMHWHFSISRSQCKVVFLINFEPTSGLEPESACSLSHSFHNCPELLEVDVHVTETEGM